MAGGSPHNAWIDPSSPSPWDEKPNRISLLINKRTKTFINKITVNLKSKKTSRWERAVECWNQFCKMFSHYHNYLRS